MDRLDEQKLVTTNIDNDNTSISHAKLLLKPIGTQKIASKTSEYKLVLH